MFKIESTINRLNAMVVYDVYVGRHLAFNLQIEIKNTKNNYLDKRIASNSQIHYWNFYDFYFSASFITLYVYWNHIVLARDILHVPTIANNNSSMYV